jgi:WXG100 family type VII secretion target
MVTYRVSPNAVLVVEEMGFISGQLQGLLSDFMTSARLGYANWNGAAKAAFDSVTADWGLRASNMQADLVTAQNALGNIMATYANAERKGADLWEN